MRLKKWSKLKFIFPTYGRYFDVIPQTVSQVSRLGRRDVIRLVFEGLCHVLKYQPEAATKFLDIFFQDKFELKESWLEWLRGLGGNDYIG